VRGAQLKRLNASVNQRRAATCDAVFVGDLTAAWKTALESCPELRWNERVPP